VDAFSDGAFSGNPAAVCTLDAPIAESVMQALANEFGISETAYLVPIEGGFSLRWFTPEAEVDLCGHATLASAHVLLADGAVSTGEPVAFQTRSGLLTARYDGDLIELDFPADPPAPVARPAALESMGLGGAECLASPFFFVAVLSSEGEVASFVPDLEAIRTLDQHALLITAPGEHAGEYVLRVFAPEVGIDEDPATGSAQCVAGPYWGARLGRDDLEVRQLSRRGAAMRVHLAGERVRIAGRATTIVRGEVELPSAA
jgi:PhzF family phenazine biosynthesis protein